MAQDQTERHVELNREVTYYARGTFNDVAKGRKSADQGLKEIKSELSSLLSQASEIAMKSVGAIAGTLQIATGAGVCYGSDGYAMSFIRSANDGPWCKQHL